MEEKKLVNSRRLTDDSNLEVKWSRLSTANFDGELGSAVDRGPLAVD